MGCVPGALRLLVIPPTWQNIHFFLRAWELCWLAREERAYGVNTAGLFLALLGLLNDSIDDISVAGTKHHDHRELEEESSPCFLSQKNESMIHRGKQSIKGQAWQQQQEAKGSHPWLYSNTGRRNKLEERPGYDLSKPASTRTSSNKDALPRALHQFQLGTKCPNAWVDSKH